MPTKYFILDASVLLSAGKRALFGFKENNVVIPMSVIETLEAKKNDPQLGFTAMSTLKEIYKLKGDSKGEGTVGSPFNITPEGGSLHIEMNHISSKEFKEQYNIEGHDKHLRILSVIYNLQKENKDIKLILVSNSISLRIKAHALNIETTEFQAKSEHSRGYYKGYIEGVTYQGTYSRRSTILPSNNSLTISTRSISQITKTSRTTLEQNLCLAVETCTQESPPMRAEISWYRKSLTRKTTEKTSLPVLLNSTLPLTTSVQITSRIFFL